MAIASGSKFLRSPENERNPPFLLKLLDDACVSLISLFDLGALRIEDSRQDQSTPFFGAVTEFSDQLAQRLGKDIGEDDIMIGCIKLTHLSDR